MMNTKTQSTTSLPAAMKPNLKFMGLTAVLIVGIQACSMLPKGSGEKAPVETRPQPPVVSSEPARRPGTGSPTTPSSPSPGRPDTKPDTRPDPRQDARPPEQARPGSGPKAPPTRIADQKIDLAGSCTQTEEDGYREQATLTVRDNQVQSMAWQLWVGKKGTCKFDFADFVQVKTRPSIELNARNGSGCKLVIYQDPRRVSLGFADCQKYCTGTIYDEAFPVMFDPKTGACADLNR
jgi:hypothetical protein